MAQSLKKREKVENYGEIDRLINAINQAIIQLREFLPRQKNDVWEVDLEGTLLPKIEEARQYIQVKTNWDAENLPPVSVDQARHLAAFLSEAMSNVIRHAKSREMEITIQYLESLLVIEVRDFGEGISAAAEQGYGLKNMRERARLLGAELQIDSALNQGTTVRLELEVKEGSL
jgi:signal transduction histidine kinase